MDPKELWSKTLPFPPGWWEMWSALAAVNRKDATEARRLARQTLVENERWKRDVKELGFAKHPWVYKLDDDAKQTQAFNPDVLVAWVMDLADDLEKRETV